MPNDKEYAGSAEAGMFERATEGKKGIRIIKREDDPNGIPRVSIGGPMYVDERTSFYCQYRGSLSTTIELVEGVLTALKKTREHLASKGKTDMDVLEEEKKVVPVHDIEFNNPRRYPKK